MRFSLLTTKEIQTIHEKLSALDTTEGLSKNSLSILKASFLISEELYHDARELLIEALNVDPQEPTLHFLLGEIYQNTGLENLAREEFTEADDLARISQ